jgi:uncharacterized membrane protein
MPAFLKTKQAPHEVMDGLQNARSTIEIRSSALEPMLNTINQRNQTMEERTSDERRENATFVNSMTQDAQIILESTSKTNKLTTTINYQLNTET